MMLTSSSHREHSARCRELNLAAYVTKPIRQAELYAAVGQALGALEYRPAPTLGRAQPAERTPLRVLLVEDNPVNQRLAVGLLAKRGHLVQVAGNGRIAVEALEKESFDLVLMDVQMPVMGGLEATRRIRERERTRGGHVPIAALTGCRTASCERRAGEPAGRIHRGGRAPPVAPSVTGPSDRRPGRRKTRRPSRPGASSTVPTGRRPARSSD